MNKKEEIKNAWDKFQNTMTGLKKRQHEILTRISEKLDAKRMEALRKKCKIMNNFGEKTENTVKQEAIENIEAPISIEKSAEELGDQAIEQSTREVADFQGVGEKELTQIEARAEKDGVAIDGEDKEELSELNAEAVAAKEELIAEIGENEIKMLEEKFGNFAQKKQEFYREISVDTLTEAENDRFNASKDAESMGNYIDEYKSKIEMLGSEIADKKSNLLNRILDFRHIRDLEKNLGIQKRILENYEKRLAEKNELVSAYDYLIAEELKMAGLMEEASKENVQWDESKRIEILAERDARDVSKLASKHGVFFVHDIVDADWKPSENNRAINTKELNFNDQLDILHGLDPTISASTLHKGSKQKTFGRGSWGVFISGGKVLGGDQRDAGTVAVGLRDRRFSRKSDTTTEAIENAILRKSRSDEIENAVEDTGYNELVIENPEIAGVYVKWSEDMPRLAEGNDIILSREKKRKNWDEDGVYSEWTEEGYAHWWESVSDVMKRGLPIFTLDMKENKARLIYDIDVKNRTFKVTPEYDPGNIADMPGIYKQHLGAEEKRKAAMRVFDKACGLIPEEERSQYEPNGKEDDGRGLYGVN